MSGRKSSIQFLCLSTCLKFCFVLRYVLVCFFFILLAAVENVLWPAFAYDRSGVEPVELMDEVVVLAAFLASFAAVNVSFLIVILMRTRQRDMEMKEKYEAEEKRREAAMSSQSKWKAGVLGSHHSDSQLAR